MLLAEEGVIGGPSQLGFRECLKSSSQQTSLSSLTPSAANLSSPASSPTISSKKLSLTDVLISQKRKWLCREEITPQLGN